MLLGPNRVLKKSHVNEFVGMEAPSASKVRMVTPNPFYHAQKRKLMQKYRKQLIEKDIDREVEE